MFPLKLGECVEAEESQRKIPGQQLFWDNEEEKKQKEVKTKTKTKWTEKKNPLQVLWSNKIHLNRGWLTLCIITINYDNSEDESSD